MFTVGHRYQPKTFSFKKNEIIDAKHADNFFPSDNPNIFVITRVVVGSIKKNIYKAFYFGAIFYRSSKIIERG